jgi:hypothetical protein
VIESIKEVAMNKELFENTVLAILKARPGMGSIQLRKALIIADALYNTLAGESITGAKYVKHKYGPVPDDEAFLVLSHMAFPTHKVDMIEEPVGYYTKNSYYPIDEPDYSLFSRTQINVINYAADTAWKYAATALSGMTHDEVYNSTNMGDEIALDRICNVEISGYNTDSLTRDEMLSVNNFLESDDAHLYTFI